MKGMTETLAQFIVNTTLEQIPDKVIHEVKRNLLDTIGCALSGLATDIGVEALTLARTLGGKPESSILGTGEKTSCALASYANARMANALDADETLPVPVHFANSIMGASLSIGERNRSSGKELITSYAVAYELASRIALGMRPPMFIRGKEIHNYPHLYTPAVLVVFASLGAAAKLLNLKTDQVQQAMGIAAASSPISVMGKWTESTVLPTLKYFDSGGCTQLGITAALLASIGTPASTDILDENRHFWRCYGIEDCDFAGMRRNLGQEWHILDTTYKPWPGIRYTHYPLWLFLKLKEENNLSPDKIQKVVIRMGPMGTTSRFQNQAPKGAISCQFNHPHAIAMGALGIEPGSKWYSSQTIADDQVAEFRRRVEVQYDPELGKIDIPQGKLLWKLPTRIEIQTKEGSFRAFTEYTKGDPWTDETYFTDDELKKKFLSLASSAFSGSEKWHGQMRSAIDMVFNAERLAGVAELCALLGPQP